ncbi:flagellar biosynthetic protein FliR [Methylomarinovum caldicuralii]|uniref:Flagellar biosynthetic protein FliR n=1 Tax=Methylomarinovum caldicuralii TaxID=438856 RepID=A0AAU9BZV2_9GAMM|nr:flagellar biosynthetic protein FliR [Methylomarinovum caldicuralii]BCX81587.1 flagellar biosynthetic protein FliR [Methylomarinovum caldicuralii]
MAFTEAQLFDWLARFLWPLIRIGALLAAMPVFNSRSVPMRVRVILAVTVTVAVLPLLPPPPRVELIGLEAVLVAIRETVIGLAIGFVLQVSFAALVFAGQNIAYSMGLGFAAMLDPQLGVQVPIISQVYLLLATLLFLGLDGHLVMIEMIAASFQVLPPGLGAVSRDQLWLLVRWSATVFSAGVLLSLPIVIALLFVNIALGVATRAAPQLNIFSVGFPITLLLGLGLIWLTLPQVLERFAAGLPAAFELVRKLLGV